MPNLQRDGAEIHFEDTGVPSGSPAAPTVVFGHGLLFSGWMFRAQIEALRPAYRCVSIDWRGQGGSTARGGFDMDTLAADAIAVIESLDAGPVHYVGLSMGGFVGQRIGARRGELLRSLTLLDTSPDREPPASAVQDIALAGVYQLLGMRPLIGQVLPLMFGPAFRADPDAKPVLDEFLDRIERSERRGLRKAVVGVATRKPIYDEIANIGVPTLVVCGAEDKPTPVAKARRIAARVPGARLEIVADSGHSSTVERPDEVTGLIRDFLGSVDAA